MDTSTKLHVLKSITLLSNISEARLQTVAEKCMFIDKEKGDYIFTQGGSIDQVYFLSEGQIKIGYETESDKTLIKNIIYDDEIFGENVFTEQKKWSHFAECMTPCKIYAIPVEFFKSLVISEPRFATEIMSVIMTRLQGLEERIHNFVFKKAKKRISEFIKRTGELRGVKIGIDECLINHGMSHKEIAYLTDTSRQTVARVLGELKRDNIIHFSTRKPGKILIRDFSMM